MAPQRTRRAVAKDPTMTDYLRSRDTTRERITTEIVDAVEGAEEELTARLDNLSQARNDRIDQLQAEHNTISLSASRPNAITQTSDFYGKNAEALTVEINAITELWAEWEIIQQKITCLGIEALGPDNPVVSSGLDVTNNRVFKKRVDRASALYKMHLRNEKTMAATCHKQERFVASIGVDVMKHLKSQQKQSRDRKRKQRQEVCQLAKEMLTNI